MYRLFTLAIFMSFGLFAQEKAKVANVRVSNNERSPAQQIEDYNSVSSVFLDESYDKYTIENFEQQPVFNTEIDYTNIDYGVLNACIVFYTNKFRNLKKMSALEFRPLLRDAAAFHSVQMVNKRFYSHDNMHQRKLRTVVDRLDFLGFEGRNMAENLGRDFIHHYDEKSAYWYKTNANYKNDFYYGNDQNLKGLIVPKTYRELAKSIVASWVKSPQHRHNMLSKDYTWIGVAALIDFVNVETNKLPKIFVTQVFGG